MSVVKRFRRLLCLSLSNWREIKQVIANIYFLTSKKKDPTVNSVTSVMPSGAGLCLFIMLKSDQNSAFKMYMYPSLTVIKVV